MVLTLGVGVSATAFAQAQTLFANFMKDPRAAQARFVQTDSTGTSSGRVVLGGMGKLRWEQTAPFESLTVSNGRVAWQVDMEMAQATKMNAADSEGWASVFTNPKALAKSYAVAQKGHTLILIPKSKETFPGTVEFNDAGYPTVVQFKTWDDKIVSIRFSQWQRLKDTPRGLFDYLPPQGMDVVGVQ